MVKRIKGNATRTKILEAGLKIYPDITFEKIGKITDMKPSGVFYHFPRGTLKDEIAAYALEVGDSRVISQMLLSDHPLTHKMAWADRLFHFKNSF